MKFWTDPVIFNKAVEFIFKNNKGVFSTKASAEDSLDSLVDRVKELCRAEEKKANSMYTGIYASTAGFFVVVEDIWKEGEVNVSIGIYVDPAV